MRGHDPKDRFQALYQRSYARVVGFFLYKGWDRETARELAQDAFLRVFPHVDSIHPAAEWTFLTNTVKNVHKNAVRDRRAKGRDTPKDSLETLTHEGDHPYDPADVRAPSPEDEAIKSEELRQLRDAIARLPVGMRQAFELRNQGLSIREVAAALRISEDAVKTRLRDARRLLRRYLAAAGVKAVWPPVIAEDADDDREE